MSYGQPRALSERAPLAAFLVEWVAKELIPAYLSLRKVSAAIAQALDDGSVTMAGKTVRMVTGVPTSADADGSVAFRVDGGAGTTMYHREAGAWVGRA